MERRGEILKSVFDKLESTTRLSIEDRQAFLGMEVGHRAHGAGQYIVREGDHVKDCCAILTGFAHRHKIVENGARQIISIHMPGDLVDIENAMFGTAGHNIQMLGPGTVAYIRMDVLERVMENHPAIRKAIWLSTMVDGSVSSAWITNLGRRDASSRVAHLLCEFAARMNEIGRFANGTCEFPMTQEHIADATGLTVVHINRTMQSLKRSGLIRSDRRSITIDDWSGLAGKGGFDAAYLHGRDVRTVEEAPAPS